MELYQKNESPLSIKFDINISIVTKHLIINTRLPSSVAPDPLIIRLIEYITLFSGFFLYLFKDISIIVVQIELMFYLTSNLQPNFDDIKIGYHAFS